MHFAVAKIVPCKTTRPSRGPDDHVNWRTRLNEYNYN